MTDKFSFDFKSAGLMRDGKIYTNNVIPIMEKPIVLGDILQSNVDENFYITTEKMSKWTYLKGAKKITEYLRQGMRMSSQKVLLLSLILGINLVESLTSESTLNRSTHVVSDPGTGRLRTLTANEAERLQGFDDDWTNSGMPNRMRFFCMGNALVVPMITRMAKVLDKIIDKEQ